MYIVEIKFGIETEFHSFDDYLEANELYCEFYEADYEVKMYRI